MSEFEINTVIPYKGKLYKVMKGAGCTDCAFCIKGSCKAPEDILPCNMSNRIDKTSIKFMNISTCSIDMSLDVNDALHTYSIADMGISVEEGVSCADCAFCNICHANGAGAKNDFYFNVKDYFGECASDKRKDGKSVIFVISGKNTLYIPSTGRLECGVSGANASNTSSASNTTDVIHPYIEDGKCNDIQVVAPGGYLIDVENSDITKGIIRFKTIYPTYADIIESLYLKHNISDAVTAKDNALHKLQNIADYYNGDWKLKWGDDNPKYFIVYNYAKDRFETYRVFDFNFGMPVFKNTDDAQRVIDNPNFRDILDNIFGNY